MTLTGNAPHANFHIDPGMQALQIRAHLASGIAHAAPWGIALDGLLASQLWAERKANLRALAQPTTPLTDLADPADLPLPLARCTAGGSLWHWAATCAHPEGKPESSPPDIHYWSGDADHRAIEQLVTTIPSQISIRKGRFRSRRMPLLVTVCSAVTWRAVGDITEVRRLLSPLVAIGKKRSSGEGHVIRWEVEPLDADPWDAGHLHPDRTLGRPTPAACLEGRGEEIRDSGLGTAGLRPPYVHPSRQHTLHLPAFVDQHPR